MKPLNKYIDHTNLKPFATRADIEKLCADAKEWDFASVCVNPCNVKLAKELLAVALIPQIIHHKEGFHHTVVNRQEVSLTHSCKTAGAVRQGGDDGNLSLLRSFLQIFLCVKGRKFCAHFSGNRCKVLCLSIVDSAEIKVGGSAAAGIVLPQQMLAGYLENPLMMSFSQFKPKLCAR